jgi:hypothetical protein
MSHTGCHAAEGELFRHALLRALETAGLAFSMTPEGEIEDQAFSMLGPGISQRLAALGASIGPPWTQREKSAALVAWLALRTS